MERLDILIRNVRDQTGNQQYTDTQGIKQREFVRYANDAQSRIYNRITQERSTLFTKVDYIDLEAGVAVYDLPDDIYLKHNVIKVDYSHNGDARNYAPMTMRTPRQEVSSPGYPDSYFLRQGQIVISPIPTAAITRGLRLNYQYTLPTLDVRRAKITSVEGTDDSPDDWTEHSIGVSTSLSYGAGLFVVVGATGQIYTSADSGETWVARISQTTSTLSSVTYGGGRFVAVGNTGSIVFSDDGITWVAATSGTASSLQSVEYGGGVFVAVGVAGVLVMSYDGENWDSATSGVNDNINFVRYLNGLFIVCGSAGDLATSPDAVTWTARTSTFGSDQIYDVTYGAGLFVIVGEFGNLATSPTGATWTAQVSSFGIENLYAVRFGGSTFVAGGSNGTMATSTDAVTWTPLTLAITPLGNDINVIGYVRGYFIVVHDGGFITSSSDAATWTISSGLGNVGYIPVIASDDAVLVLDNTAKSAYVHSYSAVDAYEVVLDAASGTLLSAETVSDLANSWVDFISVVDSDGEALVSEVGVTSYDSTTRTITCSSLDDALLDAADYYIVFGKNASTHSSLPEPCEQYLADYMALRIQLRDSNTESIATSAVLMDLERLILDGIANLEEDLVSISILDSSMLNYDEDL